MPGAPRTGWATLAFLALVIGQMAFAGTAEKIAFWSIPVLALLLFLGWRFVKSREARQRELVFVD